MKNECDELNSRLTDKLGRPGAVHFAKGPYGGLVAELRAAGSAASVALQGAQVLSFVPSGEREVLWRSTEPRPGRAARGGIPICWPWFGQHASDASKPAHGFVRTLPWAVVGSSNKHGAARISLAFETGPEHEDLWPYQARVRLDVTLATALRVDLTTENIGNRVLPLAQALHSYFAISDVADVTIDGLDGRSYVDHVGVRTRRAQTGAIRLDREVDRVFDDSQDTVVIGDRAASRRIVIAKEGSRSSVVWNPWIAKSQRLGDMGIEGYRRMVCVETANAGDDVIMLASGTTHRLTAIIGCEPF